MRRFLSLVTLVFFSALVMTAAQTKAADEVLIGNWGGTFTGDASGKFTMAFSRDAAKKLAGTLAATPDGGGDITSTFKSITVTGAKVSLAYDDPDGGEVQLEGTLDGPSLKGSWRMLDSTKAVTQSGTFDSSKS